mmetsp:Transcript_27100/g.68909  ORF Transcript_27100/g.68909 Transcript_27100/m.68909 type:complete len:81 (-) Transcript_27100:443-685(-)
MTGIGPPALERLPSAEPSKGGDGRFGGGAGRGRDGAELLDEALPALVLPQAGEWKADAVPPSAAVRCDPCCDVFEVDPPP